MEFYCVLSVDGSLATYYVQKTGGGAYKAVLRTGNSRRNDIPAEISLQKQGGIWEGQPPHDEIVQSLGRAIETGGGSK